MTDKLDELITYLATHPHEMGTKRRHAKKVVEALITEARVNELSYISPAIRRDKDGKLLGSVGGRIAELDKLTKKGNEK